MDRASRFGLIVASVWIILGAYSGLIFVGSAVAQDASQLMLDVDAPSAGANVANGQRIVVGGWAVAAVGGLSSVDIFMDGASSGLPLGSARLGINRQDVASRFSQPGWAGSGYTFDWVPQNLASGQHTLTIVARFTNGETASQIVPVNACGCGLQGSVTNPIVTSLGPLGWELDTGGPGVWMERPDMGPGTSP